jgi:hypothetical protein
MGQLYCKALYGKKGRLVVYEGFEKVPSAACDDVDADHLLLIMWVARLHRSI